MRRFFRPRVNVRPTPFSPPLAAGTPAPNQVWAPVDTVANHDDIQELVHRIRFLASMGSEDRPLVLEVCDRTSTDATAREAVRALMHEFRHGSADAQLSAARLWAILLRNSSAAFIAQSTATDFLQAVAELLASPRTSPVVKDRVVRVLGDAVWSNPTQDPFRRLWLAVKPLELPEQGAPYNAHDAILRSPADGPARAPDRILDRLPPVPNQFAAADTRWEAPPPSYEIATSSPMRDSWVHFPSRHAVYIPNPSRRNSGGTKNRLPYDNTSDAGFTSDNSPTRPSEAEMDVEVDVRSTEANAGSASGGSAPSASQLRVHIATQPQSPAMSPPSPRARLPPVPPTATPTAMPARRLPLVPTTQNRSNITPAPTASLQPGAPSSAATRTAETASPYIGLYTNTLQYLKDVARNARNSAVLIKMSSFSKEMSKLGAVESLIYALPYKEVLVQMSSELGVTEDPEMKTALNHDQTAVTDTLRSVLSSEALEQAVLALEDDAAQSFLDIVQYTLDRALLVSRDATSRARRLISKLARAADKLPSSLIISGVEQCDEHATFCGGFGDVFRAMYQGKPVALKHMRRFQATDQRDIRRKFCREALVWQRLRHPYIVPLIGIDTDSFPSSLCMVSPWMQNGTVIKYLSGVRDEARQSIVDRLIREIAQGLAFLHDQNVVHGDLRGSNILVDDDGHASLTDFGLTVLSDATTQTHQGAGSVRWMAPETLNPNACGLEDYKRTSASDIYAFACVCLELYTGFPPFHDAVLYDAPVILQVMAGERPPRPPGNLIPDHIWTMMQQCWAHNYADRPSILGIVLELMRHEPLIV